MNAHLRAQPAEPAPRPLWPIAIGIVLIVGIAGTAWWLTMRGATNGAIPATGPIAPAVVQTPIAAEIQHPIEQAPAALPAEPATPLPALGESDPLLFEALAGLIADERWRAFLAGDFLIQRFVATIDNLPRGKLAPHLLPVRTAPGQMPVEGSAPDQVISAANAARYDAYVRILESVDSQRVVALYARLYPLFQQAYRELGGPDAYFNDRLVAVIDHLIAADQPTVAPRLVRPKVFWEFADPVLEQRSAGEKLMIRLGPAHAEKVRDKLIEIRALLVAQPPATD